MKTINLTINTLLAKALKLITKKKNNAAAAPGADEAAR